MSIDVTLALPESVAGHIVGVVVIVEHMARKSQLIYPAAPKIR